MIGLKNNSSISCLIFLSLFFNCVPFNPVKSFFDFKRLFFTFFTFFIYFFTHCLSILSQYFRFYNLNVLSCAFLCITKKKKKKKKICQKFLKKIIVK